MGRGFGRSGSSSVLSFLLTLLPVDVESTHGDDCPTARPSVLSSRTVLSPSRAQPAADAAAGVWYYARWIGLCWIDRGVQPPSVCPFWSRVVRGSRPIQPILDRASSLRIIDRIAVITYLHYVEKVNVFLFSS